MIHIANENLPCSTSHRLPSSSPAHKLTSDIPEIGLQFLIVVDGIYSLFVETRERRSIYSTTGKNSSAYQGV
jgi:hypothetical protein